MDKSTISMGLAMFLFLAAWSSISVADFGHVGIRGSVVDWNTDEDMDAWEAFLDIDLPWSWKRESGSQTSTRIQISAGVLKGAGETGFLGTAVPSLVWSKDNVALDVGIGFALVGREEFGQQDFGGSFQFAGQFGFRYFFHRNYGIGVRVRHISDADSHDRDGEDANMVLIELIYRL